MAKSKNFRTLKISETGKEMIFDYQAFRRATSVKANQYERERNRKSGGWVFVAREIAQLLSPEAPGSMENCVKQWRYGYNSPSCLEDVEKMEEFFGVKLFKERELVQQTKLERQSDDRMRCEGKCTPEDIYNNALREREAARAVYELVADLIRSHKKLLIAYLHEDPSILIGEHSDLPEEYPIYDDLCNKVRKLSFDLPREVHANVQSLLGDIYGYNVHFERIDGFYEMLSDIDAYDNFVKVQRGRKESDMGMIYWHEFALEQEYEYYQILDSIFEQYLID